MYHHNSLFFADRAQSQYALTDDETRFTSDPLSSQTLVRSGLDTAREISDDLTPMPAQVTQRSPDLVFPLIPAPNQLRLISNMAFTPI
jgi:hypothetical protein